MQENFEKNKTISNKEEETSRSDGEFHRKKDENAYQKEIREGITRIKEENEQTKFSWKPIKKITKRKNIKPLYDLRTSKGNYVANNTIVHNCDAEIHETYEMTKDNIDDLTTMALSGGGGTSHKPIKQYVEKHISETKLLINFTDGYTDHDIFNGSLPYDVLWVLTSNGCNEEEIKNGEVIKIEKER